MANRSTLSPQERLRRVDQGGPVPRRRQAFARELTSLFVEAQVFYALAVATDELEGLDADVDVGFDEFFGDLLVRGFRLHAFRNHRLVADVPVPHDD